jgi:hypothetical protein
VNYDNAWEPQGEEKSGIRQYIQSLEDKVKAMETERATEKADAARAVKTATFESLGIKSSVASLYQGDANPDAIKSWVTDMRSAFGGAAPEQGDQGQAPQKQAEPVLTGDQQRQYRDMVESGQSSDTNTLADMNARLAQATNRDELRQIWQSGNF